jgi:hypothetical protein
MIIISIIFGVVLLLIIILYCIWKMKERTNPTIIDPNPKCPECDVPLKEDRPGKNTCGTCGLQSAEYYGQYYGQDHGLIVNHTQYVQPLEPRDEEGVQSSKRNKA